VLVTSEIPKLGIDFSKVDAFIKWSDTLGEVDMSLDKILDKHAIFTMTAKFEILRIKHGLTEDEFADWVHKWTHVKLAEMLTTVYIDESQGHVTLEEKFRKFNFEIKSPNMQLNVSLGGEE
jgi:hypothetical protein